MKMGIKEFRERLGELAMGTETVVLTHHGKRVGRYVPDRFAEAKPIDIKAWAQERRETSRRWRATTPDWRERLRAASFSEEEIAEIEAEDRCS